MDEVQSHLIDGFTKKSYENYIISVQPYQREVAALFL